MTTSSLQQLHRNLFQGNYLFVSYRLPHETTVYTLVQTSNEIQIGSFKEGDQGFLFAPFANDEKSLLWIEADVIYKNAELVHGDITLNEKTKYSVSFKASPPKSISKKQYLNKLQKLIESLKKNELKKAVFTRSHRTRVREKKEGEYFRDLNDKYTTSFNYLLNLPGAGRWIGASPEVLLRKKGDNYETMALAGSRRANSKIKDWPKKDIEEQEFVSEHIESQLKILNCDYKRSGPITLDTGAGIEHLCTQYSIKGGQHKLAKIIDHIHPTPAVCGLPLKESREWLLHNEDYNRTYYTGYLGPVNIDNSIELFVNLRCGQILDGMAYLYVGGGITSSSLPKEEWNETVLKSRTLLDIIESQDKI